MRGKAYPTRQAGLDVCQSCHDLLPSAKKRSVGT
jgi:hypothetical protein